MIENILVSVSSNNNILKDNTKSVTRRKVNSKGGKRNLIDNRASFRYMCSQG